MGSNQKYSLRWNDFSLNVASTFRDLHSRQVSKNKKIYPALRIRARPRVQPKLHLYNAELPVFNAITITPLLSQSRKEFCPLVE
jgi:hypothetical protein